MEPAAPSHHSVSNLALMIYMTFTHLNAQIFYLNWLETLQADTSTGSNFKGIKLMHLLCECHMHVYFPQQVIVALSGYLETYV